MEAIAVLAIDTVAHHPEKFAIGPVSQVSRPKIIFVRTSKDIVTICVRWRRQHHQDSNNNQITLRHVGVSCFGHHSLEPATGLRGFKKPYP
jgi:hypothetical protein